MRIEHFNMAPEVQDMKIYVSDLFPGNPELSKCFDLPKPRVLICDSSHQSS